ncbi:MAG: hemolysin III family protein [Acidobacteria bacterium]|nr:hemolysin III family protein [Acidobacteriota bacterium]
MSGPIRAPALPKPRLRGRFHEIAFFLAVPAGAALVLAARRGTVRFAVAVYALSLAGLFGSSAAYHRLDWSARALRRMRRLDHSMIFLLIAGTYTPFSMLALHGAWRIAVLAGVWAGAIAGIVLKLVKIDGLRALGGTLYIALGWIAVIALPQMVRGLRAVPGALIVAGGVLYTAGAVVLLRRRPDPNPRVFGYHEIWHSMVIGASACHYAAILMMVRAAA